MVLAAIDPVTAAGIITGALVSAGTLGVALRSSRGDAMARTMTGALELGDRYKADLEAMRTDMDGLRAELAQCTELHAEAAAEVDQVRHLAERALASDVVGPLVAEAGDAWVTLGAMGELQDYNRGFLRLFSLEAAEAMAPGSWRNAVYPDDLAALDLTAGHVFEARGHLHTSFRVKIDGRLVPVKARATPRSAASDGTFLGWRCILVPQWDEAVDYTGPEWAPAPPTPWGTFPE